MPGSASSSAFDAELRSSRVAGAVAFGAVDLAGAGVVVFAFGLAVDWANEGATTPTSASTTSRTEKRFRRIDPPSRILQRSGTNGDDGDPIGRLERERPARFVTELAGPSEAETDDDQDG